jgi:hypothetical protein
VALIAAMVPPVCSLAGSTVVCDAGLMTSSAESVSDQLTVTVPPSIASRASVAVFTFKPVMGASAAPTTLASLLASAASVSASVPQMSISCTSDVSKPLGS